MLEKQSILQENSLRRAMLFGKKFRYLYNYPSLLLVMVKDVPLSEITLRKYERPYDSSRRELVRKVCLSLGLLQPGDSRDVVVDILLALEDARKERKELTSTEIQELVRKIRKENSLEEKGLAESNVRRQLKRLRDLMLIDKRSNFYRLSEFEPLSAIFDKKIQQFLIPQTIERIKEYLEKLEK
jgi:hypothetical protein